MQPDGNPVVVKKDFCCVQQLLYWAFSRYSFLRCRFQMLFSDVMALAPSQFTTCFLSLAVISDLRLQVFLVGNNNPHPAIPGSTQDQQLRYSCSRSAAETGEVKDLVLSFDQW